jgi:hypothetical protein
MINYSSVIPNTKFDSAYIENSTEADNKINITFTLYWEDEQKQTWTNNLEYLNYFATNIQIIYGDDSNTHLNFKEALLTNDLNKISENYNNLISSNTVTSETFKFKDRYEDVVLAINNGTILEKIENNVKKYIFPITFKILNIESKKNISIYSFSILDMQKYLEDNEVPSDIALSISTEFSNFLSVDTNVVKFDSLIIDNKVQQIDGIINDFRTEERLTKFFEQDNSLVTFLSSSERSIVNKSIDITNPLIFSDLLYNVKENNDLEISFLLDKNSLYKNKSFFASSSIDDFQIQSFNVYRHLVDTNDRVLTTFNKQIISSSPTETQIFNENNITHYSFVDEEVKNYSNQKFIYELEINCVDTKLKKYYDISNNTGYYFDLINLLTNIPAADGGNKSLYSYYYDASQPRTKLKNVLYDINPHITDDIALNYPTETTGYYNISINRMDPSFVDYARVNYSIPLLIPAITETLNIILKDLFNVDNIDEVANYVEISLNPETTTPKTILNFIRFVEVLILRMKKIFTNVKSNTFTYNKIFINNVFSFDIDKDFYFIYNNNTTLNKTAILDFFETTPPTFLQEKYFTPVEGKIFGTTYTNFTNIPNNSNAFKENTLSQKLLSYYRILDLNKNLYDSYEEETSVKEIAFTNNCTSNSNRLILSTERSEDNTLNVRDEFQINKYQSGLSTAPTDTVLPLPNRLSPKQNFGNLFGNQQNTEITITPTTFIENPNAIKSENELLFYLFVYNTTETAFNSLKYVPIAKIQYLDPSSTADNLKWFNLNQTTLNNLTKQKYLCKFELVDTVPINQFGTVFQSIPLLASNLNDIFLKNKYFTFINSEINPTPTISPSIQQEGLTETQRLLRSTVRQGIGTVIDQGTGIELNQISNNARESLTNAVTNARNFVEQATRNFRRR